MTKEQKQEYQKRWRETHQPQIKANRIKYRETHRKATQDWREAHREEYNAYNTRWRTENRDAYNAWAREYYRKRIEKGMKLHMWMYGLTTEDYDRMFKKQKGKCAICRQPEIRMFKGKVSSLAVDHNHTTNEVRELLCAACNLAVAYFEAPVNHPKKKAVIKYLTKHKAWPLWGSVEEKEVAKVEESK